MRTDNEIGFTNYPFSYKLFIHYATNFRNYNTTFTSKLNDYTLCIYSLAGLGNEQIIRQS